VAECSDTFEHPKPPWLERKTRYLESLDRDFDLAPSVLLVSAADKLHNLRSTLADLRALGADLWTRFNSTPQQQVWYYGRLADIYGRRMPGLLADAVTEHVERLTTVVHSAGTP
jgi:hypothetical protein